MRLRALIAPLLLLSTMQASDWFSRGNDEYEAGRFERALALYDSAVAAAPSAAAYYNRGNAQFRLGRVGRAIADYQRAWVLRPQDPQAGYNLAFSRQFRPDKTLTVENPLVRVLTGLLRLLDVRTTRLLAGLSFLFALGAMALLLVSGRRWPLWVGVGFAALFGYFLLASLSWGAVLDQNRAVVVVPELVLRAGPGTDYKDIAVVHDGLEVSVRERRPEWVLIQIPGGEGGWVEAASVELVFSR